MKLIGECLEGRDGHSAGLALLEQLYGAPLPEILRTERGKPYFAKSDWHFSVSHTKNHAFCVLSSHPVGIDAEEKDRRVDLRLADKILSADERQRFDRAADSRDALLRLWVLKEAAAKLTGEGLRGYPNHTDFSPNDPRIQEIDGCYVAVFEGE